MQRNRAWLFAIVLAAGTVVGSATSAGSAAIDDAVDAALARLELAMHDPLLLPAPPAAVTEEEIVDRRRLAIARSVLTMRDQVDTTLTVLEGDVLTMLSLARNTRHLGERRRALRLYDLTVLADRDHRYTRDILEERVRCAIELGDSAKIAELALEIVERDDAGSYGSTLAASLEFLAADPALGTAVLRLVDRAQAAEGLVDVNCWIRIAQVRQRLGQHDAAHRIYGALLLRPVDLDDHQIAVSLLGYADSAYAKGDRARATELYELYRNRNAGRLSAWATYQIGNIAASTGDFDQAVALLRSICEREESTPWRDSACTRLAQVRQLQEIEAQLRPFGRDLSQPRKSR